MTSKTSPPSATAKITVEGDLYGEITVDWGDGLTDTWPAGQLSGSHQYMTPSGMYTISARDEGVYAGSVDVLVTKPPIITSHTPDPVVDDGTDQVITFVGSEFIPGTTEVQVYDENIHLWVHKTPVYVDNTFTSFKVTLTASELTATAVQVLLTNNEVSSVVYVVDTTPVVVPPTVALTGVIAGTPGAFVPADTTEAPKSLIGISQDPIVGDHGTNRPTAAWNLDEYLEVGLNKVKVHWDGMAWAAGTAPTQVAVALTGVFAGVPGYFEPHNATDVPETLAALQANGVVGDTGSAKPTDGWSQGQYLVVGTSPAVQVYWDGSSWSAGIAPAPPVGPITAANAGTPGIFSPSGADVNVPTTLADLKTHSVVGDTGSNHPASTPWATGEYLVVGAGIEVHWTGTAWAAGKAT